MGAAFLVGDFGHFAVLIVVRPACEYVFGASNCDRDSKPEFSSQKPFLFTGELIMKDRVTKKQLAAEMYEKGMNVSTIAELLRSEPSYVANALIEKGYVPNYMDLYTSTGPQNAHAELFQGVLRFRNVEAARDSVAKLEQLYAQFVVSKDRRGVHQCEVLALTGKNRAEGIGKHAEALVFAEWLAEKLKSRAAVRTAAPSAVTVTAAPGLVPSAHSKRAA